MVNHYSNKELMQIIYNYENKKHTPLCIKKDKEAAILAIKILNERGVYTRYV